MPKGEKLPKTRLPKEKRAEILGVELLEPWEESGPVWVRAPKEVMARFKALEAKERGKVIELGLKAWEVQGEKAR